MMEIESLPIERLEHHPKNPRRDLGDLTELRDSIWQQGVLQNLTVVPATDGTDKYWVIIGNRRLEAARGIKGIKFLPCVVRDDMEEKDIMKTMLTENMQRNDLTVYEQAHGFQLMMDLGSTVDEIAKETGFSKTTVNRRLRLMELDQDKLRNVSEDRQIKMTDIDLLFGIEDPERRNSVLEKIGTKDFDWAVKCEISEEKRAKNKDTMQRIVLAAGLDQIPVEKRYTAGFTRIGNVRYSDWDGNEGTLIPKADKPIKYYFTDWDIEFYVAAEKKKPEKIVKSPETIERERIAKAAWNELEEKMKQMAERREAFIDNLRVTDRNRDTVLRGAVIGLTINEFKYAAMSGVIRETLNLTGGMENESMAILYKIGNIDEEDLAEMAYRFFNPEKMQLAHGPIDQKPYYEADCRFEPLYRWMGWLGFETSDEEKALITGTHEIYQNKKAVEA